MNLREVFQAIRWSSALALALSSACGCVHSSAMPRDVAELTGIHGGASGGSGGAASLDASSEEEELAREALYERTRHVRAQEEARATAEAERMTRERGQLGLVLRAAADGLSRKSHALEKTADRTRGDSQATVYKALEALESQRAILSDLSERVDSVPSGEWDSFKAESARVLDTLRDPADDLR